MVQRLFGLVLCLIAVAWISLEVRAAALEKLPVQTVAQVDLKRYMGQWYEIAAIPMFFERRCVGNTLATYALLPSGQVEVVNSCKINTGRRISALGRAKVLDAQTHAKLKVTFFHFLGWHYFAGGDYWMIALDPNYTYAVVGHPKRRYAWILSRTPVLPKATLASLSKQLVQQGYNPCQLITTPQVGGLTQKKSLCQAAK